MAKVQLEFYNTTLTGLEKEKAENIGMLLLASDFVGSGRVNRSDKLERISKGNFTILLSQTKSGDFLAINPFSSDPLTIPLTQLPSRASITEFVSESSNLSLNKLYKKLMSFETKKTELLGGYGAKDIPIIEGLLQAPRSDRKDFTKLQYTRDVNSIDEDISAINQLVYDDASLEKEINNRLDIIEKALKNQKDTSEKNYQERQKYWQTEIENKNELLQKRMKERDAALAKDIAALQKDTDKKVNDNLQKFRDGVAKNIRKDEKPIEGSIQRLEKLVSQKTSPDLVDKIEAELIKLSDFTQIFAEAVGFAKQQVAIVKEKETDIIELMELDIEKLKVEDEQDKEKLKEESKRKEKERDAELKELKQEVDELNTAVAEFQDIRPEWIKDVKIRLGELDTALVNKRFVPATNSGNQPKRVELFIPVYIFQYSKDHESISLAVPPVHMPDSMRKPDRSAFFGDHKTVFYHLVVPESEKLITNWFLEASQGLDFKTNIQLLDNLLDNPAGIRDTFFTSRGLMVDKLNVNKTNFSKANDRLTEVFTSE